MWILSTGLWWKSSTHSFNHFFSVTQKLLSMKVVEFFVKIILYKYGRLRVQYGFLWSFGKLYYMRMYGASESYIVRGIAEKNSYCWIDSAISVLLYDTKPQQTVKISAINHWWKRTHNGHIILIHMSTWFL